MSIQNYFERRAAFVCQFPIILSIVFVLCNILAQPLYASYDSGGYIVIMSGLTDQNLSFEFDTGNKSGKYGNTLAFKSDELLHLRIFANDGSLVQEWDSADQMMDCANIQLPAGQYTLSVQFGAEVRLVNFQRQ